MASVIKFYTLGSMSGVSCQSVTSEAATHPVEHALDFNPNTFWKATSTTTQYIELDLGETYAIDKIGFVIHNHESHSGDYDFEGRHSNNGVDWTRIDTGFSYDATEHLIIIDISAGASRQYWKFEFYSQSTILEIAQLCCFKEWALTLGNQYPEDDAHTFLNQSHSDMVGNRLVWGGHSDPYTVFTRRFLFPDNTDWLKLRSAFDDSCGMRYPLFIDEDDALSFVRINQDSLPKNEVDYQLYQTQIKFRELVVS